MKLREQALTKIGSIVDWKKSGKERRHHENHCAINIVGVGSRFGERLSLAAPPRQ
jgi:hypothetical protein